GHVAGLDCCGAGPAAGARIPVSGTDQAARGTLAHGGAPMSTLHIRHLYHRYGLTEVLANVGLDLFAGEVLALVGPSGCGKSTLMHVVAGLLTLSEVVMKSTFRGASCVYQEPRLMPWKTALDNIGLGLK